jgi:hypothetical protein
MKRLQGIKELHKRAAFGLAAFFIVAVSGIGVAQARGSHSEKNHQPTPVFEEVARQIQTNPERPAPPEVLAELVSLKVTYKSFDHQTRYGIVEVNRELKDDVITFFKYAYYLNFPFKEIAVSSDSRFGWDDEKLMEANVTSCFNYRTIAGTDRPSTHGSGRACDINPRQNPYITLDEQGNPDVQPKQAYWNVGAPGTLHGEHPLIQLVESRSWVWGGRWTLQDTDGAVIDYQHIQKRAATPEAQTEAIKQEE